ncbi:hypothetical protein APF79_03435 [bacterium BRH_c32]|nr:MAG: hypothetical protein APF79_03435 [bacterium BRH_c32]
MLLSFLINSVDKELIEKDSIPSSDTELIKRINDNDIAAFEFMFKSYFAPLCNFVYIRIRNKDNAKEIVQEVFVNIYKNREHWSPKGSIKSYLYKAVKNQMINWLKYAGNSKKSDIEPDDLKTKNEPNPLELYIQKELREAYQKAVSDLPEKCREILVLVKDQGFSYKEAAALQNLSIKTVESQMRLAFQKLRKALKNFN